MLELSEILVQMFTKFIEERSFVSDTNAYHAFFDECVERAESAAANPDPAADRLVFLELEVSDSDRTVFILPPDIRDEQAQLTQQKVKSNICIGFRAP